MDARFLLATNRYNNLITILLIMAFRWSIGRSGIVGSIQRCVDIRKACHWVEAFLHLINRLLWKFR